VGKQVLSYEYILRVDEKGRIMIPKEVRDKLKIFSSVRLIVNESGEIIIKKMERNIEKYAGYFRVDWSKLAGMDIDKILDEALKERSEKWLRDILT
jgi:AbrB family looped-hinge helix DNA binding protein